MPPERSEMPKELEEFLRYLMVERNASPHTLINYRADLSQFMRYIEKKVTFSSEVLDWRDIDPLLIRSFATDLYAKGRAKSSVARKLACLRTFFKYLLRSFLNPWQPSFPWMKQLLSWSPPMAGPRKGAGIAPFWSFFTEEGFASANWWDSISQTWTWRRI
jgi:hypothetical protein